MIEKDDDGWEHVIEREHMTQPLKTFDSQAFQEIYDFFELKREAKQAELNEEFARELLQKQESEKSLFQCTVTYLTNLFS